MLQHNNCSPCRADYIIILVAVLGRKGNLELREGGREGGKEREREDEDN